MATVIPLDPYRGAKEVVAANIKSFLKDGGLDSRYAMEVSCRAVMQNHRASEMDFGDYTVEMLPGPIGLRISARKPSRNGECPTCGSVRKRYVSTKSQGVGWDRVNYGCQECGELYWCWEDNS